MSSISIIEDLARHIHEAYRLELIDKTVPAAVPWEGLPADLRQSNLITAMSFWARLRSLGFEITAVAFPTGDQLANLEELRDLLAELGHISWMFRHQADGWRYAPVPRDPVSRLHQNLVVWAELPEVERQKEYTIIQALPRRISMEGISIIDSGVFPEADIPAAALETLARGLHQAYVDQRLDRDESLRENAALRPWERLDPSWKAANLTGASRIHLLFEAISCRVTPKGETPRVPLTMAEWESCVAPLAQAWHRQWVAERRAAGWTRTSGPKDLERRLHPDLANWWELPKASQEKSISQIHAIPRILASIGFGVTKMGSPQTL